MSKILPPSLLASFIAEFSTPDTLGVGLVGSFSRGEGQPHSDVDLDFFLPYSPPKGPDRYRLHRRSGHLVSLKRIGLEDQRAELSQPENAIWAVPGIRQMKILHDPQGLLAALQAEAQQFCWSRLAGEADFYVSYQLMHTAEAVYKVMGGIEQHNPSKVV